MHAIKRSVHVDILHYDPIRVVMQALITKLVFSINFDIRFAHYKLSLVGLHDPTSIAI